MLLFGMPNEKPLHPFYVSVTEITHNESSKNFEVITKIFTDDFEHTLRIANPNVRIDLIRMEMYEQMSPLVEKYIRQHFQIIVEKKIVALNFVGFEQEEEGILCYFESAPVNTPKTIEIKADLLYEYKKEQLNLFHVRVQGKRISQKLNYPKNKIVFEF